MSPSLATDFMVDRDRRERAYECADFRLLFHTGRVLFSTRLNRWRPVRDADAYQLSVLEMFRGHTSKFEALAAYDRLRRFRAELNADVLAQLPTPGKGEGILLTVSRSSGLYVYCVPIDNSGDIEVQLKRRCLQRTPNDDYGGLSSRISAVVSALWTDTCCNVPVFPELNMQEWNKTVERLFRSGLLTAPAGMVDFGHLRRLQPFCLQFGSSRGTPIDRYYLDQFVTEVRDEISGEVLEVGGKNDNNVVYGLSKATSYVAMDIASNPGVDVIGDVHDPRAHSAESFDSIVLFNVLEHCEKLGLAVENVRTWLRSGGCAFVMVPNMQRVHPAPKDYWRILPDALQSLFKQFEIVKLRVYGNLVSALASLSGIASEELSEDELNTRNSAYPVATCLVARK